MNLLKWPQHDGSQISTAKTPCPLCGAPWNDQIKKAGIHVGPKGPVEEIDVDGVTGRDGRWCGCSIFEVIEAHTASL